MRKIITLQMMMFFCWFSVSATTNPVANVSTNSQVNNCYHTGSITIANVHNSGTDFFLDRFRVSLFYNGGGFIDYQDVNNDGSATFNVDAGSYHITVEFLGILDYGKTDYYPSVSNSYTCAGAYVTYVANTSSPLCNDGAIYLSDGTVMYGQPAGSQTFYHFNGCGCGGYGSYITAYVGSNPCNFDFSAITTSPILNCAGGSVLLSSNNPSCVQYYAARVYDSSNNLIINNTLNPGDLPYKISLSQTGTYTVIMDAYSGNGGICSASHQVTVGPPVVNLFQATYSQTDISAFSCNDGSITVTTSNDNNTAYQAIWNVPYQNYYTYNLYDSAMNLVSSAQGTTGYTFTGLAPGNYTVKTIGTRYDAQSCTSADSQQVSINRPACFTLSTSSTGVSFKYVSDGTITASINSYGNDCNAFINVYDSTNTLAGHWDAASNVPLAVTFGNLAAGTYLVKAHGGLCDDSVYVTVADGPCNFNSSNFVVTQFTTPNTCNGLQVRYAGGSGNYTFDYRNNDAPYNAGTLVYDSALGVFNNNTNIPTGHYTITGRSGVCTDSLLSNYTAHVIPVVSLTGPLCFGKGVLTAITNGTGIQSIAWKVNDSTVQANTPGLNPVGVTVAGGNGQGNAANQLNGPHDVFTDAQGNLYVTELGNGRVSKWAPGATEGVTVATVPTPAGIYIDGGGNMYVADREDNTVTKWVPGSTEGIVVAGGNGAGNELNQLSTPNDVVVDSAGNVYVADMFNARVMKWAPGATEGIVVAGGNGAGSALNQFNWPAWLSIDAAGNLYVTDYNNARVMKWVPGATEGTVVAGGNGFGSAANQLSWPTGIYVDNAGDIFVGDIGNNRALEWKPGATEGITVNGPGELDHPVGVHVDKAGNVYVADLLGARVQKYSSLNNADTTYTPASPGSYTLQLTDSNSCVATSQPFVVNTQPHAIITGLAAICAGGNTTLTAIGGSTYAWQPGGLTGASQTLSAIKQGTVYTVTAANSNNTCFDKDSVAIKAFVKPVVTISGGTCTGSTFMAQTKGSVAEDIEWQFNSNTVQAKSTAWQAGVTVAGGNGTGSFANQLNTPPAIYKDKKGNFYIADAGNNRVQKWLAGATQGTTVAGGNGYGSAANQLASPQDVFVDKSGYIYVADADNNRVQKWGPNGFKFSTVAGGNGPGNALNQLNHPTGVFVDDFGNIYVADNLNNRVMRWAPGAVQGVKVAGGNAPQRIYVDDARNIYIASYIGSSVEKWAPGATAGVVVAGGNGAGAATNQLTNPAGLFADDRGDIFVSDIDNGVNRVQRWKRNATDGVTVVDGAGNGFSAISGLFMDATGVMYINDYYNSASKQFNPYLDTTFTPSSTGSYRAIVTDFNGCKDTSNNIIIKNIVPAKPGTITGQRNNLCGGGSFAYSIAPVTNATTYLWMAPANTSIVSGQGTTAIILNISAAFKADTLKVVGINTCSGNTGYASVLPLLVYPSVPVLVGPASVSANQTNVVFTVTNSEPGVAYTWAFPAGVSIVSGQGTNNVVVNWGVKGGNVLAYGTNLCGNTNTAVKKISISVPLVGVYKPADTSILTGDEDENVQLMVYPNPASGYATVQFKAIADGKYIIELTDAAGKAVLHNEGAATAGKNMIKLDVSNYAQGMYFIRISYGDGVHILKLIKG
jgi:sugar lactone lactonase YvrE